jgi:hypothetical protein
LAGAAMAAYAGEPSVAVSPGQPAVSVNCAAATRARRNLMPARLPLLVGLVYEARCKSRADGDLAMQRKDFNLAHNDVGDPPFGWAIDRIE